MGTVSSLGWNQDPCRDCSFRNKIEMMQKNLRQFDLLFRVNTIMKIFKHLHLLIAMYYQTFFYPLSFHC